MVTMTRFAKALRKRLTNELGFKLPNEIEIQRTYAGRNQRDGGAFLWHLKPHQDFYGLMNIGSIWPVRGILKAEKIVLAGDWGDKEIMPGH